MRFDCTTTRLTGGRWSVKHASKDVGNVEVSAATREEALEKMRNEIRYRLELCPCSGDSYQHVQIEVIETPG